jgi:hypothetical protein
MKRRSLDDAVGHSSVDITRETVTEPGKVDGGSSAGAAISRLLANDRFEAKNGLSSEKVVPTVLRHARGSFLLCRVCSALPDCGRKTAPG